jgi:hypothetical protein
MGLPQQLRMGLPQQLRMGLPPQPLLVVDLGLGIIPERRSDRAAQFLALAPETCVVELEFRDLAAKFLDQRRSVTHHGSPCGGVMPTGM